MRERILDVALDLFNEHGYDATSLREIAQRLGVSKAALYYHFEQKADIMVALHQRFHRIGQALLEEFAARSAEADPVRLWLELLDEFIDGVVANRELVMMHQRNSQALRRIVGDTPENHADHEDMEEALRAMLADPRISLRQRVRLATSIDAVVSVLVDMEGYFGDVPLDQRAALVRDVARELLAA